MSIMNISSIKKRYIVITIIFFISVIITGIYIIKTVPFGSYVFFPDKISPDSSSYSYSIPLDPASPWPKFRANALQNGRSQVVPMIDSSLTPWTFKTGKGIFSSPVIDGDGNIYIGSADQFFYALHKDGSLIWKKQTGEIIDSSALLDDRKRVYFGSGDSYVYCLNRMNGEEIWKFKAHSVNEVEEQFKIKTYNVNWFEGNIGMLADGTILAPNDNYLLYLIDHQTGVCKTQYVANEMLWSLAAVNVNTDQIFFGTNYLALNNIFCFNTKTYKKEWRNGGLGTNAASPMLTSSAKKGVVIVGGYDGFIRAFAQDSGKLLWKQGFRDHIYSSPAQLQNGTIIQSSADGTVYALEPVSGKIIWAFDTLEPIRSSPCVDSNDLIYVGSGEGRLFCINPDGTLRWAYRCIDEDRNDLNSSPALGKTGVCIGGENGGIFFIPYDYPLSENGRKDTRCTQGPFEDLPEDGTYLIYTNNFGALFLDPPDEIHANQPLTFSLYVRKNGDTLNSAIDNKTLTVNISGNASHAVHVSANKRFIIISPKETWTDAAGGKLLITIKGIYKQNMSRFGLRFFGGEKGGTFNKTFTFTIPHRNAGSFSYPVPNNKEKNSVVFELSRISVPNPTILPSYNQIGFDSLHYLAGAIHGRDNKITLWVISGKLEKGKTVVDPAMETRYPLTFSCDNGLITLYNYDGFKINFIGSWDMPFGFYRISTIAEPVKGIIEKSPELCAVSLCDEIKFYGKFLKLMGVSDFKTGQMAVFGGMNMQLFDKGYTSMPEGIGTTTFYITNTQAKVVIENGTNKKNEHVYSLVLMNEETGRVFPLYYTKRTKVLADSEGFVSQVIVEYNKKEVKGKVLAYYMIDTYPAAMKQLSLE